MKNKLTSEILVSVLLIVLLALFLNPFQWFMPSMMVATLLCILVVIFLVFAIFMWKEKTHDEGEQVHKMLAGRVAFLAGAAVLVVGICVQEAQGKLDPWLLYTLAVMILAKLGTFLYGRSKL